MSYETVRNILIAVGVFGVLFATIMFGPLGFIIGIIAFGFGVKGWVDEGEKIERREQEERDRNNRFY
ncbi:hypothetical protein CPT_Mater35 [Bacillus phage Mater]|uniref:Uncharacterized protein n=1 Tax=Bacillus phage Mater TaxID=1540090 RepID=A0A0A0RMK1_9CAUD|nr:hypothetical protein CPT_Mater35 [Bacillus phage Mater]AIW03192.1 hypothetical protein CPT_Mater35 [Bacillus phage Mater]